MTQLATFLAQEGIDASTIVRTSASIESTTADDRRLERARRVHRRAAGGTTYEQAGIGKPRSGRPLRNVTLVAAANGKALTRVQRAKLLRAINAVLTRRGRSTVEASRLFGTDLA